MSGRESSSSLPPPSARRGAPSPPAPAPPPPGSDSASRPRSARPAQEAARAAAPFALRALRLFSEGRLPEVRDGRESAGPVDVVAFLQDPRAAEEVEAALGRRRARAAARAGGGPRAEENRATALSKVVHGAPCDGAAGGAWCVAEVPLLTAGCSFPPQ